MKELLFSIFAIVTGLGALLRPKEMRASLSGITLSIYKYAMYAMGFSLIFIGLFGLFVSLKEMIGN